MHDGWETRNAAAQAMTGASCGWARRHDSPLGSRYVVFQRKFSRKAVLLKFATQDATFPIRRARGLSMERILPNSK